MILWDLTDPSPTQPPRTTPDQRHRRVALAELGGGVLPQRAGSLLASSATSMAAWCCGISPTQPNPAASGRP